MKKLIITGLVTLVAGLVMAGPIVYMKTQNLKAGDIPAVSTNGVLVPSGYTISTLASTNNLGTFTTRFASLSNAVSVIATNYATLPKFIVVSNSLSVIATNYTTLPQFISVSNRFRIVETNYTPRTP